MKEWIEYWIPFVGFRNLPEEVWESMGYENVKDAFMLSWLGTSIVLLIRFYGDEQE